MNDRQSIESKVIYSIQESLGKNKANKPITSQTDICQDYKIDSLDSTSIILNLEEIFNIAIPDKDIEKIFRQSPGEYSISSKINEAKISTITDYIFEKLNPNSSNNSLNYDPDVLGDFDGPESPQHFRKNHTRRNLEGSKDLKLELLENLSI